MMKKILQLMVLILITQAIPLVVLLETRSWVMGVIVAAVCSYVLAWWVLEGRSYYVDFPPES